MNPARSSYSFLEKLLNDMATTTAQLNIKSDDAFVFHLILKLDGTTFINLNGKDLGELLLQAEEQAKRIIGED